MARPGRILWANFYCLLDTSSGASMSVRQMLLQLQAAGWDVSVLGATIFDHARGTAGLKGHWDELSRRRGKLVDVRDGGLIHRLYVTGQTRRSQMLSGEESAWFHLYDKILDDVQPDVVFYYGGHPIDMMIAREAKARGIPVVFYLANANYRGAQWCRDVTLIVTDSQATAAMYHERIGREPVALGKFIDPGSVIAAERERRHLLFVNPTPEKGALWVAALALWLEKRRPDITFEVVESRGTWETVVRRLTAAAGAQRSALDNVTVTANAEDMRPVYGRARAVLAPSLWWESGSRVLAEAMLNGIPVVATDRGGTAEMVEDGGILLRLPDKYHERPYLLLPPESEVEQIAVLLMRLYDDEPAYAVLAARAAAVGERVHGLATNSQRLHDVLSGLVDRRDDV